MHDRNQNNPVPLEGEERSQTVNQSASRTSVKISDGVPAFYVGSVSGRIYLYKTLKSQYQ